MRRDRDVKNQVEQENNWLRSKVNAAGGDVPEESRYAGKAIKLQDKVRAGYLTAENTALRRELRVLEEKSAPKPAKVVAEKVTKKVEKPEKTGFFGKKKAKKKKK